MSGNLYILQSCGKLISYIIKHMEESKMKSKVDDSYGCRNSGVPLGGIGAGSVELRPDGCFYNWYMMNNAGWGAGPETKVMEREGLRFAVSIRGKETKRTFALQQHYGLDPVPDGWFWFTDPYHIPWVEHPRRIDYKAAIPTAELEYHFEESPLQIALNAWSPFIPHDSASSNTPGIVLDFTLKNVAQEQLDVSLISLLKNGAGYDRPDLPALLCYDAKRKGITLKRKGLPEGHVTDGQFMLAAEGGSDCETTYALYPRHGRDIWDPLMADNRLENEDFGRQRGFIGDVGAETELGGPSGYRRAVLCSSVPLAPGEERNITVYVTWFFPNHWELKGGTKEPELIGHQYSNRFDEVTGVFDWLQSNKAKLSEHTFAFREAFFASDIPEWLAKAINAQFSPLLRSAWFDRKGRFGIWEGLGRCGLQTVDVSHYASHIMALLFPDLDASQQRLAAANCNSKGKIPHTMHGVFADGEKNCDKRIDLCCQFALAVWRYILMTGDLQLARDCWPVVVRNLKILDEKDLNGDGLPDAIGRDQTYDKFDVKGSSALINFGYLAALYAAAETAALLGKKSAADNYKKRAEEVFIAADQQLWNGEYYDLAFDSAGSGRNRGCLTDQLNGDWFYQQTCGKNTVPRERIDSILNAILKNNACSSGLERWLLNCSWPAGDVIPFERNGSDQVNSPWSGVEYAFAAYLMLNGRRDEGLRTARNVWERYERAGMRFDHYECGEFYHRAMSAFAVYLTYYGIVYDGISRTLTINPQSEESRFLLMLPEGWAVAELDKNKGCLTLSNLHGKAAPSKAKLKDGNSLILNCS